MIEETATGLLSLTGLDFLPHSTVIFADAELDLATTGAGQRLAILALSGSQAVSGFEGERSSREGSTLVLGPTSAGLERHFMRHLKPFVDGGST